MVARHVQWRYLRSEQGETDWIQRGEVACGCARAAHTAHLDTKPHKRYSSCEDRRHEHTLYAAPHHALTAFYSTYTTTRSELR